MVILCLGFGVAALDQVTKYLIWRSFDVGDVVPVIPGLMNLTYVRNTGAAWGMLAGLNLFLVTLSLIMLAVLIFRRHFVTDRLIHRMAVGLMIAGIVGNLIDRLRLGFVVDFLDFYWRSHPYHFPSFNVADTAICVGVGLYMISQFHQEPEEDVSTISLAATGKSLKHRGGGS